MPVVMLMDLDDSQLHVKGYMLGTSNVFAISEARLSFDTYDLNMLRLFTLCSLHVLTSSECSSSNCNCSNILSCLVILMHSMRLCNGPPDSHINSR